MNYKIKTKLELEEYVISNWAKINDYIANEKSKLPIPFYSSVDIRESKEKYAPVDHNMFPAGFNNLCNLDLAAAVPVVTAAIRKINPDTKVIGIFPESHTKNLMYLDHLATLSKVLTDSGYTVYLLSFDSILFPQNEESIDLLSNLGYPIKIYRGNIKNGSICCMPEKIDVAICNNDQSNPLPINWKELKTPIVPTPLIGWFRRQKNTHFKYYKQVADAFCAQFEINPDLIQAQFRAVENVDFESKNGLDILGNSVNELLKVLPEKSKVFVKASQGTYGMGISVVSSGEEIVNMNRKMRNKMDVGKNSIKFTSLLVQEGVETIIKYDEMPAEITVYLVDANTIGGFMRVNGEKDSLGNLNSRGMVFRKLCMCEIKEQPQDHSVKEAMYSLIARLSTIASAYEIKEVL